MLESLREVYRYDAEAREQAMSPEARLRFHQEHSQPVMARLHAWFETQFAEKKVEPNSGLGEAITYCLKHWEPLTLFLRKAGAPLDNNAAYAARGTSGGMPTSGLCRHLNRGSRSTDVPTRCNRHNQRPSRKARRRSGGRYRPGTTPDGLEWASARSLSCMSACK